MEEEDNDIQIGEAPGLLFVPGPLPPDAVIPSEQILVVAIPSLYIYVRDLIIADQAARRMKQNSEAVAQMMEALLRYKPDSPKTADEKDKFQAGLHPFNFEQYLRDGKVQKDEEDGP